MAGVILAGEVRSVGNRLKDGKIYARSYQIEVPKRGEKVDTVDLIDYELKRDLFKIGQKLSDIPVYGEAKDYGGLHVEYKIMENWIFDEKAQAAGRPSVKV